MAVEVRYSGDVVRAVSARGEVSVRAPSCRVEAESGIVTEGVPYEGEYEARALFEAQVFPTAERTMRRDFTVNAINYTEAQNESGITLTIGG